MKLIKQLMLATCALAALSVTATASAEKWDMPVRSNMQNYFTRNIVEFADEVKQATGGELEIVVHPEDSLVRQPDVKRAIQTGQVPIGDWLMSMHSNENALFGIDSVPFLASGYDDSARLLAAARPEIEKLLDGQRMRLLFVVPWPFNSFYSQDKLSSVKDFNGSKFRAFNPVTGRLAELMGATPVTVQQSEVSQAFSTGVINAMITSPATGVDTQAWDFVDYFTDVRAMAPWNLVAVNKKAFDKLDKDTQDAVLKASKTAEERGWRLAPEETGKLIETLREHGMHIEQPTEQMLGEFEGIGDTLISEWAESAGPAGKNVLEQYRESR